MAGVVMPKAAVTWTISAVDPGVYRIVVLSNAVEKYQGNSYCFQKEVIADGVY